jgi:aminoglycoside 2'-N-acetyltransferase I
MTDLIVAHTADLGAATLSGARALLYDVFADMTDDDWEHSLGGMHVVATNGAEIVGHASVIQRRLMHQGRAMRAGYVEGVGVRADKRRNGIGGAMMNQLERIVRNAYDLGALGATDEAIPFYEARGWQRWRGPSSALTPFGVKRTPEDDGAIYVLPVTLPLDLDDVITCDWRGGDVW